MDIPNWRALVGRGSSTDDLTQHQAKYADNGRMFEFDLVYKAWAEHPDKNSPEIAELTGVKPTTAANYVSQLNSTQGDVAATKLRIKLGHERSYLRASMRGCDDPEILGKLKEIDATLTKRIADLTVKTTRAEGLRKRREAAEWAASGIDG